METIMAMPLTPFPATMPIYKATGLPIPKKRQSSHSDGCSPKDKHTPFLVHRNDRK